MVKIILLGWAAYYLFKKTQYKKFKTSYPDFLKGVGLIIVAEIFAIYLRIQPEGSEINFDNIDAVLGIILIGVSAHKIMKIRDMLSKTTKLDKQ